MSHDLALLAKLSCELPLLDLFEQLRSAEMQLTLDDYELLVRSLRRGYGSASWEALQQVCRVLWVKPSANYDLKLFDRVFQRYRQECPLERAKPQDDVPQRLKLEPREQKEPSPSVVEPLLPTVPPRLMPGPQRRSSSPSPLRGLIALEKDKLSGEPWLLKPVDLPVSVPKVRESWWALRQTGRSGLADEIDIEGAIQQISRQGFLLDVPLQPAGRQRSELVVLVDEGNAMVPYFPALEPLFEAIQGGWVTPARMYRFTGYPVRFLSGWGQPMQREVIDVLLSRLHQTRTTVLVVSDAGAAIGVRNEDRLQGTARFLERWRPCVQQILWVNPLPERRWLGTPAMEIRELLGGRMLALEALDGRAVRLVMQGLGSMVDRDLARSGEGL